MNNDGDHEHRSLFVSWRDPEVGSIHTVGRLVRRNGPRGEHYSFAYLKLAERLQGFGRSQGSSICTSATTANRLFPVFANRVMPRSRPDYDLLVSRVDLNADADPFEILARTGGRRATDRLGVFAGPQRTPEGKSVVRFFARGIRHVAGAAVAVATLRSGDVLTLVDDARNEHNRRAALLRIGDGPQGGWIPDYLVDHVHELRDLNGTEPIVVVEHVNDESVATHMRLLCRIRAPWPDRYVAFSGPDFQTLADPS